MLALLVNLFLATDKIGCLRVDKLGLLEDLPGNKQNSSISVAEVAGDETLSVPRLELVETDKEEGSDTEEETDVGSPGVERSDVVQGRLVHALSVASAEPTDEDNNHHGVGGDKTGGGEVDEPEEDGDGGLASDEEGDAADDADSEDAIHGNTSLVTLHEESRGLAIASKTVEGSRRRVEVGVSTRETGSEDEEVDQAGETVDTKVLNCKFVSIVFVFLKRKYGLLPMTQGEAAAPAALFSIAPSRRLSSEEQMIPTANTPRT